MHALATAARTTQTRCASVNLRTPARKNYALQARGGAELRLAARRVCARAGVVWLVGTEGDSAQPSVEPFAAIVAASIELGTSLVIEVDGTFGPCFTGQ